MISAGANLVWRMCAPITQGGAPKTELTLKLALLEKKAKKRDGW